MLRKMEKRNLITKYIYGICAWSVLTKMNWRRDSLWPIKKEWYVKLTMVHFKPLYE